MAPAHVLMLLVGGACLAAAVLPRWLDRTPVTVPMVLLALGIGAGATWSALPSLDPVANAAAVERFTEFAVLVSLTGAGLKIDRPLGWRAWGSTWRLLAIAMPLCIVAVAWIGSAGLGLGFAAALLLGSALAPTDPVLAADVQVAPPGEGDGNETRFALTSEAGLNDGLAFPFVHLALVAAALAVTAAPGAGPGALDAAAVGRWLAEAVVWKTAAGIGVGWLVGRALGWLVLHAGPARAVTDGFAAIALTLVAYGATEAVQGYGFLGCFVAALVFRRTERDHEVHEQLHHHSEQTETLLMAASIVLLGAAIGQGVLWSSVPLVPAFALAAAVVLVIRPLTAWLSLAGTGMDPRLRGATAFFGIRGVGSFYYVAYAATHGRFTPAEQATIFGLVGAVVALSIVVHGITVKETMRRLPTRRGPGPAVGAPQGTPPG